MPLTGAGGPARALREQRKWWEEMMGACRSVQLSVDKEGQRAAMMKWHHQHDNMCLEPLRDWIQC